MDTRILEEIGLTPAEIKVYLAVLELGTAGAGQIIDRTGLQNSVAHMMLNRLVEKGFISVIKEGKRNNYQSVNPKHFLDFLDEKKERISEILPALLQLQTAAPQKPEIITFHGIRGVKEMLIELLEAAGKEYHTFGATFSAAKLVQEEWWISYHKKRIAKGIRAKLIFNQSLRHWKAEEKYKNAEVRYIKGGFEPLTETIIRKDKIGIIIWTDKPLGVFIHQKEAAESYDHFFQIIWKAAEK